MAIQEQRVFESQAKWEEQSGIKARWMADRSQQRKAEEKDEAELMSRRRELAQNLAAEKARQVEELIVQQVLLTSKSAPQCSFETNHLHGFDPPRSARWVSEWAVL